MGVLFSVSVVCMKNRHVACGLLRMLGSLERITTRHTRQASMRHLLRRVWITSLFLQLCPRRSIAISDVPQNLRCTQSLLLYRCRLLSLLFSWKLPPDIDCYISILVGVLAVNDLLGRRPRFNIVLMRLPHVYWYIWVTVGIISTPTRYR